MSLLFLSFVFSDVILPPGNCEWEHLLSCTESYHNIFQFLTSRLPQLYCSQQSLIAIPSHQTDVSSHVEIIPSKRSFSVTNHRKQGISRWILVTLHPTLRWVCTFVCFLRAMSKGWLNSLLNSYWHLAVPLSFDDEMWTASPRPRISFLRRAVSEAFPCNKLINEFPQIFQYGERLDPSSCLAFEKPLLKLLWREWD